MDPDAKCFLPGVPRITYMPYPFQIVQSRDQVTILYEYLHTIRYIYLRGEHPAGPIEWWMGDSRGRWDGDTLVVDVVHFNADTWFDRAGNHHSEALHVIERYTGLSRILREADFDVVGAVRDGQRLIDAATRLRPDVIITDLSMPGLTGLEVLARLKTERLDSRVIVLTMHHDADLATDAIRGGASGFLLKESAGDELLTAVRHALDGNVYITPTVTKDVMERMTGAAKEPQLTPRQRDILRLIVKGQRMKEIAANLGLSTRTVEGHKYDMMETLGVTSTAELVRYALDRRLKAD